MPEPEEKDPKIIVDSDWKEQVQKEKEPDFVPKDHSVKAEPEASEKSDAPAEVSDFDDGAESSPPPPPASLEVLTSMLFTQAMAMLGQMPNPATGKPEVNKPYAKHYIDTLEMLGEKTKGNTTDEEEKMLSDALHAIRMAYVNTKA